MFINFVATEYYKILKEVTSSRQDVFVPKYPVDVGDATVEIQQQRQELVASMTKPASVRLENMLQDKWANELSSAPAYLQDIMKNSNSFSQFESCLLYTSPSPRDRQKSRMPSSA